MAYIVMACAHRMQASGCKLRAGYGIYSPELRCQGSCRYDLYSHALHSGGLHIYGLYSCGIYSRGLYGRCQHSSGACNGARALACARGRTMRDSERSSTTQESHRRSHARICILAHYSWHFGHPPPFRNSLGSVHSQASGTF